MRLEHYAYILGIGLGILTPHIWALMPIPPIPIINQMVYGLTIAMFGGIMAWRKGHKTHEK